MADHRTATGKAGGHRSGHHRRIATRLDGLLVGVGHGPSEGGIGPVRVSVPGVVTPDPRGEGPRFHEGHVDPVWADLEGQ